ncbi:MAG: carbon-nitrogen hydrolase family protein [Caulobacteraceae bacterium]|nr:carbon-nitrogen hydrolase family protein [Caulobacteraceae bacterium]
MTLRRFTAAVAHAAPVWLDPAATAEKAASLIGEAAHHGAALVAFPESFLPGFPLWAALHAPIRTHEAFAAFATASVIADGSEVARVRQAAARHGVFVSFGFSERNPSCVGGLWNSNLLIGDDGAVLVHHRKLVPTFFEKLAWNGGDGDGLRVADTRIGRLGALICGENTNPLARYALIAQGEQVHVASYPPAWPTRPPSAVGEQCGNYDNRAANRIRAAAHAFEGKCFVAVAAGWLDRTALDALAAGDPSVTAVLAATPRAESFFVDPTGAVIGDTLTEEGLGYAEFDLARSVEPKRFHDVAAGYNRFDVFDLSVRRERLAPIRFRDVAVPSVPSQEEAGNLESARRAPLLRLAAEG